ncbi:tripartite tricarboxylate transporter substrate binding protein [Bordetella sputigena]|uniref:Bug family tripartite tricarboxylate transporter substrate binding protein n=1 Tax=Bordetella sputigena TaxID=1416810 RepID=UPI0039F02F7D
MHRGILRAFGAIVLGLCAHLQPVQAQGAWPDRPVHVVVPFPAGGATDFIARALGERMSRELGQPFIIDNRPGAASMIGSQVVARAPADGYTLLLATSSSMVANRFMYKTLDYDPDSFEPISLLCITPLVLVSNNDLPAKDIGQLITYAKAHPDALSYASYGTGTQSHLAMAMLNNSAGTRMSHVPYKGAAEALPAVMGGHVQLYVDTIISSLPYIKSGKVRALAVTTAHRTPLLPDVAPIADQGYPGFDLAPWYGLVAPRGTPAPVLDKLRAAMAKVMAMPEFVATLAQAGAELPADGAGPAAFTARMKADIPLTGRLMKAAGVAQN